MLIAKAIVALSIGLVALTAAAFWRPEISFGGGGEPVFFWIGPVVALAVGIAGIVVAWLLYQRHVRGLMGFRDRDFY